MGMRTQIEWCTHTFNPWWGCTKVSEGCRRCYAEAIDRRRYSRTVAQGVTEYGGHWGSRPRLPMGARTWHGPIVWDAEAHRSGTRPRVFCGSMCDWLDPAAPAGALERLWTLIGQTPHLDWLLVTKRPHLLGPTLCQLDVAEIPANVWLGTSIETQPTAEERLCFLLDRLGRQRAPRFASVEPLLDLVDLWPFLRPRSGFDGLDWVIVGGESGPGARGLALSWVRSIVDQCRDAGVPVFVKQLGTAWERGTLGTPGRGEDPATWPEWARVRQFPGEVR